MGCGDQSGCEQDWVCDECVEALSALWRGDVCASCSPPLSGLVCAYAYHGPVPGLVQALKYRFVSQLALWMAQDMARASGTLRLADIPLVVPAPMHPRRERKRGSNQAEALSRETARLLGYPHAQALTKLRNTRQQARLDHAARAQPHRIHNRGRGCAGARHPPGGRRLHHRRDHARLRAGLDGCGRENGLWPRLRGRGVDLGCAPILKRQRRSDRKCRFASGC